MTTSGHTGGHLAIDLYPKVYPSADMGGVRRLRKSYRIAQFCRIVIMPALAESGTSTIKCWYLNFVEAGG